MAFESVEAESNRAVAYARDGDRARAKQLLDEVLARDPRALHAFVNRRSLAIEDGELEPAAVYDELPRIAETNPGASDDPAVARFAARIAEHVVELDSDLLPRELAFSPDGARLLVRGARGFVVVDATTMKVVARHRGLLAAAAFATDGGSLLVASADRWRRLSLPALDELEQRVLDGARILAVRGDGGVLAMMPTAELAFGVADDWHTLGTPACHDEGRCSMDGRFAATHAGGLVEVWDLAARCRLEYFRLPVGGRVRNVFEYERVDLGRLVNNLPYESRDTADATLLPDRVHVATAGPDGVAIWALGIAPAVSTLVRTLWPQSSTHVAVSGDRLAAIVRDRDDGSTTLRIAGTLAPRPSANPWELVVHRPLEPAVVAERRQLAEILLEVAEAGELASARELVELQQSTPVLRDDIGLSRRLHRATLPFGLPVAATARFARGVPAMRDGTVLLDRAGERLFVELDGRVRVHDLDSGEIVRELAIGPRRLVALGASDRLLLLRESRSTGDLFTRYDQIAAVVDLATGAVHEIGRCTHAVLHPEHELVVLDDRGRLAVHDGKGLHQRDLPIRGSLPRFLGDGSTIRVVDDLEVLVYRFDEPLVVLGAARCELRLGGRSDPRVSADGRYLLEREDQHLVLLRTSDGGRHVKRGWSSLSARRFAALPDPPQLDAPGRLHERPDGLVAILRGARAEVWIVDYTCLVLEDVIDELSGVVLDGKSSARWPSYDEPFAQLDAWLDRWDDLSRLSARPRIADTERVATLRAAIVEQLAASPLDSAVVTRRAALVDPVLAHQLGGRPPHVPQLRITSRGETTRVPLSRTELNTLGRHPDNTIQLLERTLGKEHCSIRWDGARWLLHDQGGIVGTWLGAERIVGERAIEVGQPITMGSFTIVIED